ncbi:FecR protein [Dyadobacter jejuensis]|uniref:FecR protein n=1 Tax=Dyadobacter jejuensis TaxID=1082580 RepID=A0A316AFE9_9BACT|nr:FecR family protein [Dyadobacter jejuensis]PWJ55624.1 FecR protein [Dyadobacter jejuensis]
MRPDQNREELLNMIRRYVAGKASEEERSFIEQYYDRFNERENILERAQEEELKELEDRLLEGIQYKISESDAPIHRPLWRRWGLQVAAGLLLVLASIGVLLLHGSQVEQKSVAQKEIPTDFTPGGNKAILTLSDGSTVVLDAAATGQVAEQGQMTITKTDDGQIVYNGSNGIRGDSKPTLNRVSTPPGGEYRILLPDGTKVWLNAMSSMQYPTFFAGNERRVTITGECYFEVAPNKEQPFIVNVNGQQEIIVTGTTFNVNAYNNERFVRTTLVEGKVRVAGKGHTSNSERVLNPGEQSILAKTGRMKVKTVDIEEVVAWKNGLFQFRNSSLPSVMNQIARWYNVSVEIADGVPKKTFTGKIHRNVKATQILDILKFAGINFRIEPAANSETTGKIVVIP